MEVLLIKHSYPGTKKKCLMYSNFDKQYNVLYATPIVPKSSTGSNSGLQRASIILIRMPNQDDSQHFFQG